MPNGEKPYSMTHLMGEYPLSLDLVPELKKLCLCDWEQPNGEIILELPLSDEQITAIQERKSLNNAQAHILDKQRDLIMFDGEKNLALTEVPNQLTLGSFSSLNEDWYTILLTLHLTDEQDQIVTRAAKRAEIYNLTHDNEGNLILPLIASQSIQPVAVC